MAEKKKLSYAQSLALGKAQDARRANLRKARSMKEAVERAARENQRKNEEHMHHWHNWEYRYTDDGVFEDRNCDCGSTQSRKVVL